MQEKETNLRGSLPLLLYALFLLSPFTFFLLLLFALFFLFLFAFFPFLLLALAKVIGLGYDKTSTMTSEPRTSSFSLFSFSRISRSLVTLHEWEGDQTTGVLHCRKKVPNFTIQ